MQGISANPRYPSLYQINTRVWLRRISDGIGRAATLDDIADEELDRLASLGFDWLWFLSVWETGDAGREISRTHPPWQRDFRETLPDLHTDDIIGSGFAIRGYRVAESLGGDAALARLRGRLHARGMRLMLDFVPNHGAPDHPWTLEHPDFLIVATMEEVARAPQNFLSIHGRHYAMGRDPYFDGWPDTVQWNYSNPALQEAMSSELCRIAAQCDGVRCDMAMLQLPGVFERTWGRQMQEFWPQAIRAARSVNHDFLLLAEVYWDMEWTMQQQGFDYAYDKRLYDRLQEMRARDVRAHLQADMTYQNKLLRFLENHDEPRAATAFSPGQHEAAAIITCLSPGMRLFHQGQFEGRKKRISPHLGRAPAEDVDASIHDFYTNLLAVSRHEVFRHGDWQLLECSQAWQGNESHDNFIAFSWSGESRWLIAVNYAPSAGQCHVRLPSAFTTGDACLLNDVFSGVLYRRDANLLESRGLYLDVGAWQYHVFECLTP
jgi:glycosidase